MIRELQTSPEPSVTGLVTGIVHDVQQLMQQQLALFKHEIKENLQRSKEAAVLMGLGIGIGSVGGLLLFFMLVYLLNWAFAGLPLWACYLIVGVLAAGIGGGLLFAAIRKLQSVSAVPEKSIEALKENVQWIRNPK
ncbi:MAG TPA: phage holin family protein [Gemmataceae bacterium]|jgi:hypothetical protein|nr:phage holin family protein [Gemmataceae bacterium]